jgi:site-specific DNA-methyltransferase (cytosine-N4-specific)
MMRGTAEELDVKADLIFTSPPWRPLETPWYAGVFAHLGECLTAQGSMVVVLGNEWLPPNQTTRTLMALHWIAVASGLEIAQMFVAVHDEPLMSPSVADEMKGVKRASDVHSYAWWLTGKDPKVHPRGRTSVIDASTGPADWAYNEYCYENGFENHPAAMPVALPEFFVKLLTDRDDLVVDPFAGSNATGAAAERLGRRWMAVEPDKRHVDGSRGRFAKVRANV